MYTTDLQPPIRTLFRSDPESMPALYQRLRHSLRRRIHQQLQGNTFIIPPSRPEETHDVSQSDDEHIRRHSRSESPPLPIIRDQGPPTSNRYANADIFWNSTMIEANDNRRSWLPPSKPGKLRPEDEYTGRSRLPKTGPYEFTRPKRPSSDAQGQGSQPPASRPTAARQRTNASLASRNLERSISYGRERTDNDLTLMFYAAPDYSHLQPRPPRQERLPSPLPADTSDLYSFPEPPSHQPPLSLLAEHMPEAPTAFSNEPTSRSFLTVVQEEGDSPRILHVSHSSRSSLSSSSVTSTTLTWNMVLNRILHNEAVDPDMKQRVKERVRSSKTTNGDGEGERFYVAAAEAGLVPNFSYPVAGSAFYDRKFADASPFLTLTDLAAVDPISGGDTTAERDAPTGDLQPHNQDFNFGFNLPNGIPTPTTLQSYRSSSPSNSSTSPTSAFLSRQPTPADPDVARRLNALLTELLSQSELDLFNSIVSTPANTPQARLTHSLNASLIHLQDRTTHLEDILLPRLGAALERKTFTIDVLSIEIQNLGDRITELKTAVDFGNKIIAGCWVREFEVMRTLIGIRDSRKNSRVWARLMGCRNRACSIGVADEEREQSLTKREVDALVLMAEQNLGILKEDVDDMVERVEKCKRAFVAYPAVECEEGSWRDI